MRIHRVFFLLLLLGGCIDDEKEIEISAGLNISFVAPVNSKIHLRNTDLVFKLTGIDNWNWPDFSPASTTVHLEYDGRRIDVAHSPGCWGLVCFSNVELDDDYTVRILWISAVLVDESAEGGALYKSTEAQLSIVKE